MAYRRDDDRDLAYDTDRRVSRYDRYDDREDGRSDRLRHREGRSRRRGDDRFTEDEMAGRRGYGSSWSDGAGLGEGVRYHGARAGYGDLGYSGGYGSDRGGVTYGLSGAEGGFDADDRLFDERQGADPWPDTRQIGGGAYGGQKGGLSGGYGRRESGQHREQAAIAGAFGGRRGPRHSDMRGPDIRGPDMRGRGPKGYTRSDERIREAVCDALTDDPLLDAGDIEVDVAGGEVTLSGTVSERAAKRHAEDVIEAISGVRDVQNNLRIVKGPYDPQKMQELT